MGARAAGTAPGALPAAAGGLGFGCANWEGGGAKAGTAQRPGKAGRGSPLPLRAGSTERQEAGALRDWPARPAFPAALARHVPRAPRHACGQAGPRRENRGGGVFPMGRRAAGEMEPRQHRERGVKWLMAPAAPPRPSAVPCPRRGAAPGPRCLT